MSSVSFQSPFCNTRLLWGVSFLLSEKPMVPQDRSGPCSLYSTTSWHIPPCHGLLTGNFRKNSYYIQDKSLLGCTSVDLVSVASFHLLMLTTKVKTRETREAKTRDSWSWTGVQKRVVWLSWARKAEVQERTWKPISTFSVYACITFANIALALAGHVAKPRVRIGEEYKVTRQRI